MRLAPLTEAQRSEVTCPRARIQTQMVFNQNLALNQPVYNPHKQEICPKGPAGISALSKPRIHMEAPNLETFGGSGHQA